MKEQPRSHGATKPRSERDGGKQRCRDEEPAVPTFPRSYVPTRPAFTLVELMVVVVILGILATVATISVRDYLVTGKQNAAKQEMAQIISALELFYLENDRYPTNQEGLAALTQRNDKHPDGLLRGGDLGDPWGHPYEYVCPGLHGSFDLVCYGADGAEGGTGGAEDLRSWEMR